MSAKLTDAELAMFNAALSREDKCIAPPAKLVAERRRKVGEKLIEAGFARQVKAKGLSPVWRTDDESETSYSLKLSAAGERAAKEIEATAERIPARVEASKTKKPSVSSVGAVRSRVLASPQPSASALISAPTLQSPPEAPRPGSKIANVIALLERETGATISDLISATAWLPHTTRAALTGLRKRGYRILLDRSDGKHASTYRIQSQPTQPGPAPADVLVEAP
jgi:hypothetical protein